VLCCFFSLLARACGRLVWLWGVAEREEGEQRETPIGFVCVCGFWGRRAREEEERDSSRAVVAARAAQRYARPSPPRALENAVARKNTHTCGRLGLFHKREGVLDVGEDVACRDGV